MLLLSTGTKRLRRILCLAALSCLTALPVKSALLINEFQASNVDDLVDADGDFEDWIEILNTGPASLDLAGYGLSDDLAAPMRWLFPSRVLAPGERLVVFASGKDRAGPELHSNFALKATGEPLLLSDAGAQPLDAVTPLFLPAGISWGRSPDGGAPGFYYEDVTPDAPNDTAAYTGIAAPPSVEPPGGFYPGGVSATASDPGGAAEAMTWTLGGWDPGPDSTLYSAPIPIVASAVLRIRSFETGKLPSPVVTRSYLVGENMTLPTVSIVTDPDNLWDYDTGIYVLGPGDTSYPYDGANFWQDWERPAHLEYFPAGGANPFALDLGIKIHGNMSRTKPQKSLRLMLREGYGAGEIAEPLFAELGLDLADFERLILRNASNDWCIGHLRDGYAQNTVRHLDLDCQAHVPHVVFLNGDYWGVHNLREYLNEHYLNDHHGINKDNLDILEGQGTVFDVVIGDNLHYEVLNDFLIVNSLADSAAYAWVGEQMEIDNFAEYNVVEVFFGNMDWPRNNRRYWRPRSPGGRWRWFVVDLDFSIGLFEDVEFDNLAYATAENGGSQNPPWATLMLRRLLENEGFRRGFINRYLDHLNSTFSSARTTALLDLAAARIDPEMTRHMERWDRLYLAWLYAIEDVREFMEERPGHAREHLRDKFGLGDTFTLTLDVAPPGSGAVSLTAHRADSLWSGLYLTGNPIDLRAEPAPGYSFAGWSDPNLPDSAAVSVSPNSDYAVTAFFALATDPPPRVVINELNYNSSDSFDPGDWVELYNDGFADLDLTGWEFRDENDSHSYAFAPGTILPAQGYLLLCEDRDAFTALFPGSDPVPGNTGFGFSGGGELLRLFNAHGLLHDSLTYDDVPPWPPEADGDGPTLELIHPDRDNAQGENWAASSVIAPHGTPGAINSVWDDTAAPPLPPPALRLAAPWPNPFNPATRLAFELPAAGRARLSVYDVRGREVARLIDERLGAGAHAATWRGVDDAGRDVAAGLYLVLLEAGGERVSKKAVLLK